MLQVGVGHLFFSLRVDPFLLVGVQAVGIHLLFVRVGKVAEVEGKVAVLVAQPDVRQVGDAIGQDGLSVDRPADVYGAVVDLESGYQDLLRYFEPVCLVGLEVSQVLVVPPEQGVLPVEGRTVAARHVVVVEQVLAAVVTRDARVGSDPDVSLFVFGDAAHEVVAQPVLGAVGLHDAVFRGREDGQPVHIAHIQQSVSGSMEGADGRVGNAGCFFISCFQPFFLTVVSVEPRSGTQPEVVVGCFGQCADIGSGKRLPFRVCKVYLSGCCRGGVDAEKSGLCPCPDSSPAVGQQAPYRCAFDRSGAVGQFYNLEFLSSCVISGQGAVRIPEPQVSFPVPGTAQHRVPLLYFGSAGRGKIQRLVRMEGSAAAQDAPMEGREPQVAFVVAQHGADFVVPILVIAVVELFPQVRPDGSSSVRPYPQDALRVVVGGNHACLDVAEHVRGGVVEYLSRHFVRIVLVQADEGIAIPRGGQVPVFFKAYHFERIGVRQLVGRILVVVGHSGGTSCPCVVAYKAVGEGGHPNVPILVVEEMVDLDWPSEAGAVYGLEAVHPFRVGPNDAAIRIGYAEVAFVGRE